MSVKASNRAWWLDLTEAVGVLWVLAGAAAIYVFNKSTPGEFDRRVSLGYIWSALFSHPDTRAMIVSARAEIATIAVAVLLILLNALARTTLASRRGWQLCMLGALLITGPAGCVGPILALVHSAQWLSGNLSLSGEEISEAHLMLGGVGLLWIAVLFRVVLARRNKGHAQAAA